ncbi:ATP-dependent DNA helicase DinG [Chromatiaceae bacterium AAb-1]|nr:ATP-dependent DNA helicase DinG [Chromatiaceae bacterium AAb-1]
MLSNGLKTQIKDIHIRIKSALPNYQPRPSQSKLIAEMANIIAGSYHNYDRTGLIEAGTGTGKSLAYLLAAIPYALSKKKKVVIATATVALQEQLVNKDLPFFQKHSQLPFEFCLVKGRQRYACIERIKQQIQQPELFGSVSGSVVQFEKLLMQWKTRQWLGDKDTLPAELSSLHDKLWPSIAAEHFHCSKADYRHHDCPFHLARNEIADSDVLVTNHALLLADLDAGNTTLPSPEDAIYIIDEAHHLPDAAREFFSAKAQLNHNKHWLDNAVETSSRLAKLLPESSLKDAMKFEELCTDFITTAKPVEAAVAEFDKRWFSEKTEYRFTDAQLPVIFQKQAQQLAELSQKALTQIEKLHTALSDIFNELRKPLKLHFTLLQELSLYEQKFSQQHNLWQSFAVSQTIPAQQARWLVYNKEQELVIAHACPLYVGYRLEQLLFSQAFACILCSATLTTLNTFSYIRHELGLSQHEGLQTLQVTSPFCHEEKGVIVIPNMKYEPTEQQYTAELAEILPQYLPQHQGSLVLFASYWQMQQVAEALRGKGYSLLVQGEASRQALLRLHSENCRHNHTSILFGTQSFSEGLDLPGKLLTNLVITKLPFAVPTSPLEEAMAEAISRKGGNAFLQLTIPRTANKLVQACGRLLRQEQDQGQIVILDRRLISKSYGAAMLNALPPFRRQIEY